LGTSITPCKSSSPWVNTAPINAIFSLSNRQESDDAKSGEKAGCGARVNRFALRQSIVDSAVCGVALSKCNTILRFRSSAAFDGRFCMIAERMLGSQKESLSAEFQQGKGPAETSNRSAFILAWISFVPVESAPLLHQESTCGHVL
jgi:hypothetical protein